MNSDQASTPGEHAFINAPHKTLVSLSIPVLISLIAEPLTGLVDTRFVASLGSTALAALGVGTVALSSFFWMFNFLGIGTQTGVAQALGQNRQGHATRTTSLALSLGIAIGVALILIMLPLTDIIAGALGATGLVRQQAVEYMDIRLYGAPAVLVTMVLFGALRGVQDMRTPMWIAALVNGLNIVLDAILIFGYGPLPALGVAGSAYASTISQWIGAGVVVVIVARKLGYTRDINFRDATALLIVGRDLFFRTGLLFVFLLLATRVATQAGANSGAAHQAIRQVFILTALVLEAFATTAQSLVGYFMGGGRLEIARKVANVTILWALGSGVAQAALMLAGQDIVIQQLVPRTAIDVFVPAWIITSLAMPLNALAFITDGIHWGSEDYKYLRNAMLLATIGGGIGLLLVNPAWQNALAWVWVASLAWISIRAVFGLLRIWPGIGDSPWKRTVLVGSPAQPGVTPLP
jgi:MATE family multidrug resistance protein